MSQRELLNQRERGAALERQLERRDDVALQAYLACVSSERDTLKKRLTEMKKSARRDTDTDRAQLRETRGELAQMRFQLRAAYKALVELESQASVVRPEELEELSPLVMDAGELLQ